MTKATRALIPALAALALLGGLETGWTSPNGKVSIDPVESVDIQVPDSSPVELGTDADDDVVILSQNAPRTAFATAPVQLRGFTANVVSIRFERDTFARFVIEASGDASELTRSIGVECKDNLCGAPTFAAMQPGLREFLVDPSANPFRLTLVGDSGQFDMVFAGFYEGGTIYQLVFYLQKDKGDPPPVVEFDIFIGAQDGSVEIDPELKLLAKGVDPSTGCTGTDIEHIQDAVVAIKKAKAHADNLHDKFDVLDKKTYVKKKDDQRIRDLLELAKAHLDCAAAIVADRTDLDDDKKNDVLEEIQFARLDAIDAQDNLDAPSNSPNPQVRDDFQLGIAIPEMITAIGHANLAGAFLDVGYTEPDCPSGYDRNAPIADVADVMQTAAEAYEEELENARDTVKKLRDRVRQEGSAGLRQIIASNQEPACLKFLEATLIGELASAAVAADLIVRNREIARRIRKRAKQVQRLADKLAEKTRKAAEQQRQATNVQNAQDLTRPEQRRGKKGLSKLEQMVKARGFAQKTVTTAAVIKGN